METRRVEIGCDFLYQAEFDTPAVFQVQPWPAADLQISGERWDYEPAVEASEYLDLYGNRCTRMVMPTGTCKVRYRAFVDVPDSTEDVDEKAPELAPQDLPDDVLVYTMPSRYCLPDMLGNEAWSLFADTPPGYGRVQAICDYVNGHLQFAYGSSGPASTAVDVHTSGFGVCRDFTHLAISFCRALNIPARYVFGYLPFMDVEQGDAEPDFAAWMEVWLGDRWWTFDPRNNEPRKGRILIGRGRDASDVAMVTTFGGPWLQEMTVLAREVPADEGAPR